MSPAARWGSSRSPRLDSSRIHQPFPSNHLPHFSHIKDQTTTTPTIHNRMPTVRSIPTAGQKQRVSILSGGALTRREAATYKRSGPVLLPPAGWRPTRQSGEGAVEMQSIAKPTPFRDDIEFTICFQKHSLGLLHP